MRLNFSRSPRPQMLGLCSTLLLTSLFLQGAKSATEALELYSKGQYSQSADAFEAVVTSSAPDARLFYYAALANRAGGRSARAKQLCTYIVTNFADAPEAALAQQMLTQINQPVTPAAVKSTAVPSGTQHDSGGSAHSIGGLEAGEPSPATTTGWHTGSGPRKKMAFVFTTDDIAHDGPSGVDQTNAPNCWFESSMAALAGLSKGQRMIAQMIRYGDGDKYIVRFPGDGVEYVMSEEDVRRSGVHNRALWASLLDYAERQKFPGNRGANGADGSQSRLEIGLGSITGNRAEVIYPGHCDVGEISSFINGAVRSQNPVVCGTSGRIGSGPQPIVEGHAYTIIGWDSSRNMVILRNPHGRHSQKFHLSSDPQHLRFEQQDDGVFKMSVPLFHDCFGSAARSFI